MQVVKWIGGCDYLVSFGVSTIAEITPDKFNFENVLKVLEFVIVM